MKEIWKRNGVGDRKKNVIFFGIGTPNDVFLT
jgi:hypothetical protein